MKEQSDSFILSTGKELHANRGIIGLNKEDGIFKIFDGYDGFVYEPGDSHLSKEELLEIADYMIGLWNEFRNTVESGD